MRGRIGSLLVLGLLLGPLAGCATAGPEPDPPPVLHPVGYPLPKGPVSSVPAGERTELTVPVGGLVELNDRYLYHQPDRTVLVLAQDRGGRATYQAVGPGQVVLENGPVGHPCRDSGRGDCGADATPPPAVWVTVGPPAPGTAPSPTG